MNDRISIKRAAGSTIVSVFNSTERGLHAVNRGIGTIDNLAGIAEGESYAAYVENHIETKVRLNQLLAESPLLTEEDKAEIKAAMPRITN